MIYTYFEDDERAPCLASGAVYCPLAKAFLGAWKYYMN